MKLALLLNVVDPLIGGVLIMGHRGTGKSTLVRAIADLLPQVWRAADCHYHCDPDDNENLCGECFEKLRVIGKLSRERANVPVINLPLGATEDRVCGTIDIERALKEGVKAFEPGLLASANRGFLYVDEVNLLDDHLVDLLLDVAVTGRNSVEREGISLEHPARFVLVGSGNPEEGELRPQLVDRFGLCAEVQTLEDVDERVKIVDLREAFERDPIAFRATFESEQEKLRRRLGRARKLASQVKIPTTLMRDIVGLCLNLSVDGHRGELTIARSSRALAAFEGRRKVTEEDIRRVAPLALRHRLRRNPLDHSGGGGSRIEQTLQSTFPMSETNSEKGESSTSAATRNDSSTDEANRVNSRKAQTRTGRYGDNSSALTPDRQPARLPDQLFDQNFIAQSRSHAAKLDARTQRGTRNVRYNSQRGRYAWAAIHGTPQSIVALDATLRANVLNAHRFRKSHQTGMGRTDANCATRSQICMSDVRYKAFTRKQGTLFIMAIDTSGSMALNRIEHAKGALVWLLDKSYVRRDRVALVSFRGRKAEELLHPSQSMSRARRVLDEMLMGGSTPLASALVAALNIAHRVHWQGAERTNLLIFTDGRANVTLQGIESTEATSRLDTTTTELAHLSAMLEKAGVSTIIVDTQNRFTSGGEARQLAEQLRAQYFYLST